MSGRVIAIAVDDSESSNVACSWAKECLLGPEDRVHLISVKYIIPGDVAPIPPLTTSGPVGLVAETYAHRQKEEAIRVDGLLQSTAENVFNDFHPSLHALEAIGGASGVAESIVNWCKKNKADCLVLGSRHMGAAKSALMSLIGFGSVGQYSAHHLDIPVCIVHQPDDTVHPLEKVLVCVDDSESSRAAVEWACTHALREGTTLHLASVSLPAPYDIAEEDCSAAHVLSAEEIQQEDDKLHCIAEENVKESSRQAVEMGIAEDRIVCQVLESEGGASDVSLAIQKYVKTNDIDVVMLGSRGMGDFKRCVLGILGLGSVSDWCAKHLHVPVVIVPPPEKDTRDAEE